MKGTHPSELQRTVTRRRKTLRFMESELKGAKFMTKIKSPNTLKDALHNTSHSAWTRSTKWEVDSIESYYGRGIVVGIVSALVAIGWTFEQAVAQVAADLPEDVEVNALPAAWVDEIQKHQASQE